jgi:Carboxypeptidase regulatory-like domain/TonB dependent receptor
MSRFKTFFIERGRLTLLALLVLVVTFNRFVRHQSLMSRRILPAILAAAILSIPVLGQTETGQIIGKVTDPQGAVISGAEVVVKSVETGATRIADTNSEGNYIVTNLQPGIYEVQVQAAGFAVKTERVNVTVGSRVSLTTQLSVGPVTVGSITVVAGGIVDVNTRNQEMSDVITTMQVRELPTLTRNPYDLVGLSGNVTPAGVSPAGASVGFSNTRGVGYSINGQRASGTGILLDGGDNVDYFTSEVGQAVPLDSVQEFRVITSDFSAEYGRATGGIINVATKTGSNEFHGSAYEFYRGAALASNTFENNANSVPKGNFVRNQFGFSAGGPVMKDKLFFFANPEWLRLRNSQEEINLVPTAEFLARTAPATQSFFNAFPLQTQINGPIFNVGDVNRELGLPDGTAFSSLPASLPAFGQVRYNLPSDIDGEIAPSATPQNSYNIVGRMDWNMNQRMQLYGRYAIASQDFFQGTNSFSPYQGFNTGEKVFNQNMLLNLTYTFNPTLVSQTKFVFNRLSDSQPLGEQPPTPTLYMRGIPMSIGGFDVALPGYLPFDPGSAIPFGGPQNLYQFYQDFNNTRGNHTFRFGGSYIKIQDNRTFGAYQTAVETLGASDSDALDNMVNGLINSFQTAVDPQGRFPGEMISLPVGQPNFSRSNRYNEFGLYGNDTWLIKPRLSLNLGIRYDYFGVQHNKNPQLDSNFYYGPGATLQEQIRQGQVLIAPNSPVGGLWDKDKNNFAPRLGIAWDMFGNGKTSLRGGYGISYERNFGNVTFNVIQNPPNYAVVSITEGATPGFPTGSLPVTANNLGPLQTTGTEVLLPPTSLRQVAQNIGTAYAHFWSASLQHEVMPNMVASINYTGSAGRNLYSIENTNQPGSGAVYLGDSDTTSRLNNQYTGINTRGKTGKSNYNAMVLELASSRLSNMGLQFTSRYTYSHSLDNLSTTFSESSNNFNLGLLDPFNPNLDYGSSDFDVRHRFANSFNWEVPSKWFNGGVLKQVLGGWELSGIIVLQTGTPFTVFDCTNQGTAENSCPRLMPTAPLAFSQPNTPREDPNIPNRFVFINMADQTPGPYINTITGTSDFGPYPSNMTTRNAFRGPGYWNIDMGVYKNFRIKERYDLQFRSEFYNFFNNSNLFIRGDEAEISTGFVPAFRSGRRAIQLALKFIF